MNTDHSKIGFWDKKQHYKLLVLVFPMILANITSPLIGLVDTAVLGHMGGTHYLAGASVAALILTQIYWVCGFLRMSTTGLSAQSKGTKCPQQISKVFYQSAFSAIVLGLVILTLSQPILAVGLSLSDAEGQVRAIIVEYFNVRVWGAPAALANLAVVGWLLGQQKAKFVMLVQVIANLLNVVLNISFVFGFGWGVSGVAAASILTEYFISIVSVYFILRSGLVSAKLSWFGLGAMRVITRLNSHMLIRNLALQACLIFMTFQGIRLGQQTAAVNAILMQFFVLISLGLDAVAYAVEALIGEAKGALSKAKMTFNIKLGLFWSSVFACIYSVFFIIAGEWVISLLTDLQTLINAASNYLIIIYLMPVIAHWCFLLDGVFIGLTRAKAMQYSMLLGTALVFFPLWWVLQSMQNWALWIALLGFMAFRGASLGGYLIYLARREALID